MVAETRSTRAATPRSAIRLPRAKNHPQRWRSRSTQEPKVSGLASSGVDLPGKLVRLRMFVRRLCAPIAPRGKVWELRRGSTGSKWTSTFRFASPIMKHAESVTGKTQLAGKVPRQQIRQDLRASIALPPAPIPDIEG